MTMNASYVFEDERPKMRLIPVELFVETPQAGFSTEFIVKFKFGELVYSDYKLLPFENTGKDRRWFTSQCILLFTHDIIPELHKFVYAIGNGVNHDSINIDESVDLIKHPELFIEYWDIGGDLLHVSFKKFDDEGNNFIQHFLMTRRNLYKAIRQMYCYFGEKGGWKFEKEGVPYEWNNEERARLDANLPLK